MFALKSYESQTDKSNIENLKDELLRLNPDKEPNAEELMQYQINGFQFLGKMINRAG